MTNDTLTRLRANPYVSEILIESDHGKRIYFINLKPGYATENGNGQTCGSETTLKAVADFLRSVAPQQ